MMILWLEFIFYDVDISLIFLYFLSTFVCFLNYLHYREEFRKNFSEIMYSLIWSSTPAVFFIVYCICPNSTSLIG